MKTTKEILTEALGYIKQGWTTGWFARDATNNITNPLSLDATSFCAVGAIRRAVNTNGSLHAFEVYDFLRKSIGIEEIPSWNDTSTKEEVIKGFEKAIELAN